MWNDMGLSFEHGLNIIQDAFFFLIQVPIGSESRSLGCKLEAVDQGGLDPSP
jgi:hypothetical protein